MKTKECRLCHRIGTRDFLVAGAEQWECGNDRACKARKERRDHAEGERRWNAIEHGDRTYLREREARP